jgi:phosphatidylglycerol:prolipoprotein diacylglycerol transferase
MFLRDGILIGTFKIYYYALIILTGVLLAAWLASRQAKKKGINSDLVWDMLPWLLIAGIIGARVWHILTPPASMVEQGITTYYYLTHPLEMLNMRNGGLGIPGAVIGGAIALYFYARRHKISFATWVDIIAPGLALAQAVGRWGNFFNQEVYGAPTDLPWKLFIDSAHRLPEYADVAYYHPLFLYEFIYNLLNMAFLLWLGNRFARRLKTGDIFLTYLIVYPVGRFFLEFLRLDPSPVAGINVNQTIMAVIAVCAAAALIIRHIGRQQPVVENNVAKTEAEIEPPDSGQ